MNDDPRPLVVRHELAMTDPDRAEQYMRENYAHDSTLTITGRAEDFTFSQSTLLAPGFAINRPRIGVHITDDAVAGPDDGITVVAPTGSGRIAYTDTHYPLDVHAAPGDVVLFPPSGPLHVIGEPLDGLMVQLDRPALARHAAATTGLDPHELAFEHLSPISPAMARYWTDTVAHVRDDILTDPWAATNPIMLAQAFRSLAAALLSTFPNTALARATDPEAPPVHGDVPTAKLREVADYLEHHAHEPVGPADLAALADAPYREVVEGFHRRDARHPAQQLWLARLRGVYRDLHDADPQHETVPAIAARWGFTHHARFRVAYTRTFGETPEHTRQR